MITEILIVPFQYDFMIRALIASVFCGVTLSTLGAFTINRNMGFMADAMAHATLPIIAVGVFFGFSISELGVPAAIVVALFLGYIVKNWRRHINRNNLFYLFCFRFYIDQTS